jgi:hypothetical protein
VKAVATAGKIPLPEPGGMVTEPGTARLVEFELRLTVPPPVALRVTVQVVEAPGASVAGLHASELRGATREMAAERFAAPSVAVMTAPCEVAIADVDAVNAADAAPAGTVKVAGTVNSDGRLLEIESDTPPAGAALEIVTVHAVAAFETRLAAAQLRPERVARVDRESVVATDEPFFVAVTVTV